MSALSSPTSGTSLGQCPKCSRFTLRPYGLELALYAYYLYDRPIFLVMRCSNCDYRTVLRTAARGEGGG